MSVEDQRVAEPVRIVFLQQDPLLAETYRIKLELDGCRVIVANASDQALRDLRSQPPDVIFLDASSGVAADGAILEGLRVDPTTERIPVIILSNQNAGQLASEGLNLGPLDYLVHRAG
jgi:DNA-binding response OmpR family regulator